LIVSLQDFHWIQPRGLERWVELSEKYPKGCFSAWVVNLGEDHLKFDPRVASQFVKDERDPFVHRLNLFQEIDGKFFEMNFACIPREAIEAIGGWDEDFDRGWHWENVDLGLRLNKAGYKTYLDGSNFCVQLYHTPDSFPHSDLDEINRQLVREKHGALV